MEHRTSRVGTGFRPIRLALSPLAEDGGLRALLLQRGPIARLGAPETTCCGEECLG